ncbi:MULTISPECIES: DUF2877 domain-containing protein [unclassified Jeotgalibaca]|uniref:DUF2877 domain-containing protein n=1 Tax=unclassified Jeotgalibaca TaxID=2621505 RepID=UPI003FD1A289
MEPKNKHGIKSNFLSHVLSDSAIGTVHSIFKNSFNLIFQGQLVHVGKEREGISAFGLVLPDTKVDALIAVLEVGNRVIWRDEVFSFYTRQEVIQIDTKLFIAFDCRIPSLGSIPDQVVDRFKKLPIIEKTDFFTSECNRVLIDMFIDSSLADSNFQEVFIQHFLGRGQGLTPSGDDMLMGILIGEKAVGGHDIWISALEERLTGNNTTAVSHAYYDALIKGYTSSHFVDLLQAIKRGEWEKWDTLIEKISKYGHTSGWDTLFGLSLHLANLKGVKI